MAKVAAVIGVGPSGLLSAIILGKNGYNVTVYEKESAFGGRVRSEEMPETKIKVERGAMFVHDSNHPVSKLFSGGRYYEYESSKFKTPIIGPLINAVAGFFQHYVIKPIHAALYNKLQDILSHYNDELVTVPWGTLIDYIYSEHPTLNASNAILSSWYGKCLRYCVSKNELKDMVQS